MKKLTAELYQVGGTSLQLQGTDSNGKRFICTYGGLDEKLLQDWKTLQSGKLVYDWDCDEYTDEAWVYPFDSGTLKIAVLPDDIPMEENKHLAEFKTIKHLTPESLDK